MTNDTPKGPSILDDNRINGRVILKITNLCCRVLLYSSGGNTMENSVCHYNVTYAPWGDGGTGT